MGKTYVPGLKGATAILRRYIARYRDNYRNNVSIFLFALADLLLDIADILIAYLAATSTASGHYDPEIPVNDSPYINQVNAAVSKFNDTVTSGS